MEETKETTQATSSPAQEETMEQKVYRKMRTGLTRGQAVNSVKREEAKRARSRKSAEKMEENPPRFITAEAWKRGIRFEDIGVLTSEELKQKFIDGGKRRKGR